MIEKKINFSVEQETIDGVILTKKTNLELPKCISIHGAGKSIKENLLKVIAQPLLESGFNILGIDFSGHGNSTGELQTGSLKKRVNECISAINESMQQNDIVVCGESMGGYIAIKMLEFYKVNTLILFCPAVYDGKAYDIQFNKGFTEIIRQHESWRNTDVISLLTNFTGNLLIIMGDKDEVIPPGVVELINKHTPNVKRKEIYNIANCPHKIDLWLLENPIELRKLQNKIQEYIL